MKPFVVMCKAKDLKDKIAEVSKTIIRRSIE